MKKVLLLVGAIIALIGTAYWVGNIFAPGSYPNAEVYMISVNEEDLIKEIANFKKANPQYCVPVQVRLSDGRTDSMDYWFHIYFYYPEERQILYTWVRAESKGKTKFAFVSINDGLTLGKWKDINKDFNRMDNKMQKEKFETLILNRIKDEIKK